MPDGLTHVLAGYIGVQRWIRAGQLALFLTGCLLPDIFYRGGRLFFFGHPERDFLELYLTPLHTPITCLFVCIALAQFFHAVIRKRAFMMLYAGGLAHFVPDLFQRTIMGFGLTAELIDGYHWLYPIGWHDFQFGLFWPEDASYALMALIPAALCIYLYGSRGSK